MKPLRAVAMALALLGAAGPAAAQTCALRGTQTGWDGIDWTAIDGIVSLRTERDKALRGPLADLLRDTAGPAVRYFRAGGFAPPAVCTGAPFRLDLRVDEADNAYYSAATGVIGIRVRRTGIDGDFLDVLDTQTGDGLTLFDFFDVVMAHEIFHGIQEGILPISTVEGQGGEWIVEGTANAVGVGYARSRGRGELALSLSAWRPEYDVPLHRPTDSADAAHTLLARAFDPVAGDLVGTRDPLGNRDPRARDASRRVLAPYTRGHFFFHMGRDMGFEDGARWLARDYTRDVADGVAGLRWLDGVLRRRGEGGLAAYYPRFIARNAATLASFSPQAGLDAPWVVPLSPGDAPRTTGIVAPVAATPIDVRLTLDAPGPERPWFVTQRLEAEALTALTMVVDRDVVAKGRPYQRIMLPGDARWLTRVVNVSDPAPWVSRPQAFDLVLGAAPIEIRPLGACARPGDVVTLAAVEPATDAVAAAAAEGRLRWRLAGGEQVGPMQIRLPVAAGRYPLQMEVQSGAGWRGFEMAKVEVSDTDCMVRVVFGGGQVQATYVPDPGYTEMVAEDGVRVYFREGAATMFTPQGGWVDFPPEMAAELGRSTTSDALALGGLDPEEIALEKAQIHLPLMLATIFDRASIEAAQKNLATSIFRAALSGLLYSRAAFPEAAARPPPSEGPEPASKEAASLDRCIAALQNGGSLGPRRIRVTRSK
jgi:hypothetical protein